MVGGGGVSGVCRQDEVKRDEYPDGGGRATSHKLVPECVSRSGNN